MPYFAPGANSSARQIISRGKNYNKRLVNYTNSYSKLTSKSFDIPQPVLKNCECISEIYNKNVLGSSSPSTPMPYKIRVSKIVTTYLGGKTQYGNVYLNQPLQLNYFGRAEGMPGGFGSPPLNKF